MEKETKIATLKVDLEKSKNYRDALCVWLHEKAEEIKNIDDSKYTSKPTFNFYI